MTKEDVMGNQSQLHPQTRENLLRAMRREAFAFARYLLYATQAREHGRQEVAELFEKVAEEEYFGHFTEQALELGLIGMEAENLHLAIEEEAFEAQVMYRDFQAQADTVGDHAAAERFRRLRQDERRNRDQFLTVLRTDPGDAPAPAAAAHPDMGRLHLAAPAAAAARGPLGRVVVPRPTPTEPGSPEPA